MKGKLGKKIAVFTIITALVVAMLPVLTFATGSNVAKIGDTEYATLEEAIAAAKTGDTIEIIADEIDLNSSIDGIVFQGQIDENGKPMTIVNSISGGQNAYAFKNFVFKCELQLQGVKKRLIDNCKFSGTGNALRNCYVGDGNTFTISNCEFNQGGQYGIHFDGSSNGKVVVNNSIIRGTVAIAGSIDLISFRDCYFAGRSTSSYCNINIYNDAVFNNCLFSQDYTSGASRGILMLSDSHDSKVVLNNCSVETGEGVLSDIFRRDYAQGFGTIEPVTDNEEKYIGGLIVTDTTIDVASGHTAVFVGKNDDTHNKLYIVGKGAAGTDGKLTAGLFTLNPIAYVAEGYSVKASGAQTYPYEVYKTTTPQKEIVVEQKTVVEISEEITGEERTAAEEALENTLVKGVADALTDNGKDKIVKAAVDDDSDLEQENIDNAKQVDISIAVKAEVTQVKTVVTEKTDKVIAFELTPYAVVTATSSTGAQVSSDIVKVDNAYLAKTENKAITVQLGSDFEPVQAIHIREDGIIEIFSKGTKASYKDRTFTYESGIVTLEITQFSELQLLGDEKYVDVKFDANGGSGTMETMGVEIGKQLTLPENKFTAPKGKEFKAWSFGGKEYKAGDKITVNETGVVKAVWKDGNPLTGDFSNIILYVCLGGLALFGFVNLLIELRKRNAKKR